MKRFCVLLSVVMYFGFAAISYGAAVISVEPSDIKSTARWGTTDRAHQRNRWRRDRRLPNNCKL